MDSYLKASNARLFDDAPIARLVQSFYEEAREDPLLGPVFAHHIDGDWKSHLDRMTDFWTTILCGTPRFRQSPRGAPPALHQAIDELTPDHFERWLSLFSDVAKRVFTEEQASVIEARARRMGRALSAHLSEASP